MKFIPSYRGYSAFLALDYISNTHHECHIQRLVFQCLANNVRMAVKIRCDETCVTFLNLGIDSQMFQQHTREQLLNGSLRSNR